MSFQLLEYFTDGTLLPLGDALALPAIGKGSWHDYGRRDVDDVASHAVLGTSEAVGDEVGLILSGSEACMGLVGAHILFLDLFIFVFRFSERLHGQVRSHGLDVALVLLQDGYDVAQHLSGQILRGISAVQQMREAHVGIHAV